MGKPSPYPVPYIGTGDLSLGPFTDNFTRANGSLGSNWANFPGSDNPLAIASNLVVASVAPSTHAISYYTAPGAGFNNNQFSQVVIGAPLAFAPLSVPTLAVRCTSAHLYNDAYTSNTQWQLGVIIGAIPTDFDGATINVAPANGNTIALYAAGSNPVFFWGFLNNIINVGGVDLTNLFTGGVPGVGVVETNSVVTAKDSTWNGGSLSGFSGTASDNFTRADAGWLGVNWWFAFSPSDVGGGWVLASNAVHMAQNSASRWGHAIWTTALTGNQSIITLGNVTAGDWVGPIVRYTPVGNGNSDNLYALLYHSGSIQVWQRKSGTWTAIGTSFSYTPSVGDILELDASGSSTVTLNGKINGTTQVTATDSTSPVAGLYCGFTALGTNTTTVTGWSGS